MKKQYIVSVAAIIIPTIFGLTSDSLIIKSMTVYQILIIGFAIILLGIVFLHSELSKRTNEIKEKIQFMSGFQQYQIQQLRKELDARTKIIRSNFDQINKESGSKTLEFQETMVDYVKDDEEIYKGLLQKYISEMDNWSFK